MNTTSATVKIVGFAQLRNELSKGNLKNWFKSMEFCDFIYIFDQASDDGSLEEYDKHENVVVVKSPTNRFQDEITCKGELLRKLLDEHPDTDWVFWMDGDTLLDNRLTRNNNVGVFDMIARAERGEYGEFVTGIELGHYNLWRSRRHYRVDNLYHGLDESQVCAFWKNDGTLHFPTGETGLHTDQVPRGAWTCRASTDFKLVHYGFATEDQIINRYDLYKGLGQEGWELDRLLDESTLEVKESDPDILPDFVDTSQCVDPTTKKPVLEIYNERQHGNG